MRDLVINHLDTPEFYPISHWKSTETLSRLGWMRIS
jgi:hypothetical protein